MSIRKDEVQVEYTIDGKQAINELGKLESEMAGLAAQQKSLQKAYDKDSAGLEKRNQKLKDMIKFQSDYLKTLEKQGVDPNHGYVKKTQEVIAKYTQELTENSAKLATHRAELTKNEEQIRANVDAQQAMRKELGLSGLTNTQLDAEYKARLRLVNNLKEGTEEYTQALHKLHEAEAVRSQRVADKRMPKPDVPDVPDIPTVPGKGGGLGGLLGGNLSSMLAGGALIGAAATAASKALEVITENMGKALDRAREKSKALAGMAAITGLDLKKDAADIRFYGDSAEYMASKFNMSVPDVIAGMSKIGSIKPELLGAKESLAALTEEAITLSKADGMLSVEDAAIALVGSLNQFDKGADQSTRFMNVLAASASAGGAEINEVAASFKVAGAVLSASNVSFEQSNALVQVLAKRQLLGAEAGTALRNVFSKLMIANDELNPSIVGTNTALDNLAKLSPQQIVKMFGQENLVAAKTLIDLRGEVSKLTAEMTGTSEAVDQAKKRMDNLDEDLKGLGKAWDRLWDFSENQSSGFRSVVQWFTKIFNYISDIRKHWDLTWADALGPFVHMGKLIDTASRAAKARESAAKLEKERESRKEGAADYQKGTTEANLNQYQGKTQFEKERAYAKEFLAEARHTYGKLDKQIKYLESNPVAAKAYDVAKMRRELARMAGRVVAGKDALEDIRKSEAANKKMRDDIKRGQQQIEEEKKKNGHKSKEETLAENRLDNQVKVQQEIAKMNIDAIEDDRTRELAQAKWKRDREKEEREKLVKDKKMSQADFDAWLKASEERSLTEIRDINKKHDEKLEKEKLEVAVRLARAVKALQLQDAQYRVEQAQLTPGNDRAVLDARQNLSLVSEKQTLDEKEAVYLQEREKYKHNKEVLATLEDAYQKEVKAIQNNGQRERLQMFLDYVKQTEIRERNAKLEALSLEAQEYEFKGNLDKATNAKLDALVVQQKAELASTKLTEQEKTNILRKYQLQRDQITRDARIAQRERDRAAYEGGLSNEIQEAERRGQTGKATKLRLQVLNSQMQAELNVANLTEQEKTNILKRYQLERDAIIGNSIRKQATDWLEIVQAGVQGAAQIMSVKFDNEATRENDAKERAMRRLDDQKEKGIITDKEYSDAKEKLDKESEEKQRKLRRKRAEAEKKEALFSAGIQMGLNILKAGVNPFAIALATITGLAQITAIASREIPEFYEGGFPGGKNQIISVNEKGQEWIAPNWQFQDPQARAALDWLEYRRANKIVGSNGPNLMDVASGVNPSAAGGNSPAGVTVNVPGFEQFTEVVTKLSDKLDTLEAKISYDHAKDTFAKPAEIQDEALAPRK